MIEEAKEDDSDDENLGVIPNETGPDGVPLHRNPTDFLNNYFINMVAISFTNIDTTAQREQNNFNKQREKEISEQMAERKKVWEELT